MMKTRYDLHLAKGSVYPSSSISTQVITSSKRLTLAKWQAVKLFSDAEHKAKKIFVKYIKATYKRKKPKIVFLTQDSIKRIYSARVSLLHHNLLGQTDGDCIEINTCPMPFAQLVCTLIHEAFHDWCIVNGRSMSCLHEHRCMELLGDPLYD